MSIWSRESELKPKIAGNNAYWKANLCVTFEVKKAGEPCSEHLRNSILVLR